MTAAIPQLVYLSLCLLKHLALIPRYLGYSVEEQLPILVPLFEIIYHTRFDLALNLTAFSIGVLAIFYSQTYSIWIQYYVILKDRWQKVDRIELKVEELPPWLKPFGNRKNSPNKGKSVRLNLSENLSVEGTFEDNDDSQIPMFKRRSHRLMDCFRHFWYFYVHYIGRKIQIQSALWLLFTVCVCSNFYYTAWLILFAHGYLLVKRLSLYAVYISLLILLLPLIVAAVFILMVLVPNILVTKSLLSTVCGSGLVRMCSVLFSYTRPTRIYSFAFLHPIWWLIVIACVTIRVSHWFDLIGNVIYYIDLILCVPLVETSTDCINAVRVSQKLKTTSFKDYRGLEGLRRISVYNGHCVGWMSWSRVDSLIGPIDGRKNFRTQGAQYPTRNKATAPNIDPEVDNDRNTYDSSDYQEKPRQKSKTQWVAKKRNDNSNGDNDSRSKTVADSNKPEESPIIGNTDTGEEVLTVSKKINSPLIYIEGSQKFSVVVKAGVFVLFGINPANKAYNPEFDGTEDSHLVSCGFSELDIKLLAAIRFAEHGHTYPNPIAVMRAVLDEIKLRSTRFKLCPHDDTVGSYLCYGILDGTNSLSKYESCDYNKNDEEKYKEWYFASRQRDTTGFAFAYSAAVTSACKLGECRIQSMISIGYQNCFYRLNNYNLAVPVPQYGKWSKLGSTNGYMVYSGQQGYCLQDCLDKILRPLGLEIPKTVTTFEQARELYSHVYLFDDLPTTFDYPSIIIRQNHAYIYDPTLFAHHAVFKKKKFSLCFIHALQGIKVAPDREIYTSYVESLIEDVDDFYLPLHIAYAHCKRLGINIVINYRGYVLKLDTQSKAGINAKLIAYRNGHFYNIDSTKLGRYYLYKDDNIAFLNNGDLADNARNVVESSESSAVGVLDRTTVVNLTPGAGLSNDTDKVKGLVDKVKEMVAAMSPNSPRAALPATLLSKGEDAVEKKTAEDKPVIENKQPSKLLVPRAEVKEGLLFNAIPFVIGPRLLIDGKTLVLQTNYYLTAKEIKLFCDSVCCTLAFDSKTKIKLNHTLQRLSADILTCIFFFTTGHLDVVELSGKVKTQDFRTHDVFYNIMDVKDRDAVARYYPNGAFDYPQPCGDYRGLYENLTDWSKYDCVFTTDCMYFPAVFSKCVEALRNGVSVFFQVSCFAKHYNQILPIADNGSSYLMYKNANGETWLKNMPSANSVYEHRYVYDYTPDYDTNLIYHEGGSYLVQKLYIIKTGDYSCQALCRLLVNESQYAMSRQDQPVPAVDYTLKQYRQLYSYAATNPKVTSLLGYMTEITKESVTREEIVNTIADVQQQILEDKKNLGIRLCKTARYTARGHSEMYLVPRRYMASDYAGPTVDINTHLYGPVPYQYANLNEWRRRLIFSPLLTVLVNEEFTIMEQPLPEYMYDCEFTLAIPVVRCVAVCVKIINLLKPQWLRYLMVWLPNLDIRIVGDHVSMTIRGQDIYSTCAFVALLPTNYFDNISVLISLYQIVFSNIAYGADFNKYTIKTIHPGQIPEKYLLANNTFKFYSRVGDEVSPIKLMKEPDLGDILHRDKQQFTETCPVDDGNRRYVTAASCLSTAVHTLFDRMYPKYDLKPNRRLLKEWFKFSQNLIDKHLRGERLERWDSDYEATGRVTFSDVIDSQVGKKKKIWSNAVEQVLTGKRVARKLEMFVKPYEFDHSNLETNGEYKVRGRAILKQSPRYAVCEALFNHWALNDWRRHRFFHLGRHSSDVVTYVGQAMRSIEDPLMVSADFTAFDSWNTEEVLKNIDAYYFSRVKHKLRSLTDIPAQLFEYVYDGLVRFRRPVNLYHYHLPYKLRRIAIRGTHIDGVRSGCGPQTTFGNTLRNYFLMRFVCHKAGIPIDECHFLITGDDSHVIIPGRYRQVHESTMNMLFKRKGDDLKCVHGLAYCLKGVIYDAHYSNFLSKDCIVHLGQVYFGRMLDRVFRRSNATDSKQLTPDEHVAAVNMSLLSWGKEHPLITAYVAKRPTGKILDSKLQKWLQNRKYIGENIHDTIGCFEAFSCLYRSRTGIIQAGGRDTVLTGSLLVAQ